MRDEVDCQSSGLRLTRQQTKNALEMCPHHELFDVRQDWNAGADMLAGQALQRQAGLNVTDPEEVIKGSDNVSTCQTTCPLVRDLQSVQRNVGECTDCETGKVRRTIQGASSGNIVATYPFQVIAMDHIPSLLASYKGNTELLVWVDLLMEYVVTKANSSRSAQTVYEAYEEAVFRRFAASEAIRHDRGSGFMADFFKAFSKMMGQRQRATLAYHLQANGAAERMVQTVVRAVKTYIMDIDQRDWDEYAEHLTFALNTSYDRTRDETPFYLVNGWDARSTLEATLSVGNTSHREGKARRWRLRIQRNDKMVRAQAPELVPETVAERARRQNEGASQHSIETVSEVWLNLDRLKPGYARKLAHMWHGSFRFSKPVNACAARPETAGTTYRLLPTIQISKLKHVQECPSRLATELAVTANERFDFDDELLLKDSWDAQEQKDNVVEVAKICDMREDQATRYG
ncbi:unnamed protein product [Phytophthora fragariaefolia]|uniref:Unnamed protein product n=1 Tax=Phytophthora fragariaefolia TaxID=1490495 RepID=A0A9W6Y1J9_9STRA|nr:unnamed protein product [Phytophthora fragariaefolia]